MIIKIILYKIKKNILIDVIIFSHNIVAKHIIIVKYKYLHNNKCIIILEKEKWKITLGNISKIIGKWKYK